MRPATVVRMVSSLVVAVLPFFLGTATAAPDPGFGAWSTKTPAPGNLLATHTTLLRNNKILVVGGSSYNCCFKWGKEEARLYDIATNTWGSPLASPAPYGADKDAFCSGHAHDNLGGVIFQGGLLSYERNGSGIPDSARYDVASGAFTPISGGVAHWYPTLVAGEQHMFNFPGVGTSFTPDREADHIHSLPYGGTAWSSTCVRLVTKSTYPRVVLLPNGRFFIASPAAKDRMNYTFDPKLNEEAPAGHDLVPESQKPEAHGDSAWRGSGVLLPLVPSGNTYPRPRFALLNGFKAWVKDLGLASPTWQQMGTRPAELADKSRIYANATLLPTGQVFVTGGVQPPDELESSAVLEGEVYDPDTNEWLVTSPATVPRNYHGVALLLPDGRIWTASGSQDHQGSHCGASCEGVERTEERVEIFTPWYVGRPDRPVITAPPPTMISDGRTYTIGIGGSQGQSIERVVLMRPGSPTHSFDANQRLVQLDIVSATASTVTVKAPYMPAAAPPGDYMLFALRLVSRTGFKRWVPSVAAWTRVANGQPPEGASIWRFTGDLCSDGQCAGWQRLDNNAKTMAVFSATLHHEQQLYQLHNDGEIWQFTNTACIDDWCPGWQRLGNNHKTVMLAPTGNQLYQLHNDGGIWRYTGTPCALETCTGWEPLDTNTKTIAIAASGRELYQLHNDGGIYQFTGAPCANGGCSGWRRLDRNNKTVAIAAAGTQLYQLQTDGWIWEYTGAPCVDDTCSGWRPIDRNSQSVAIAAAGHQLVQLQKDGGVWQYTNTPCGADACPGWRQLDANSRTTALAIAGGRLFQRHYDGRLWRATGAECVGASCPGWDQVDDNPRTGLLAPGDPGSMGHAGEPMYQLHTDPLIQLHSDGEVWRFTGTECDEAGCPGWQRADKLRGDRPGKAVEIAMGGGQLFQRRQHPGGRAIWKFMEVGCDETCWQEIDTNPRTAAIVTGGTQLYQRHENGEIWRYLGRPCGGGVCPGWQQLDRNPLTIAIAATTTSLFQMWNDGRIWRYTGEPCGPNGCNGWELLSTNPETTAIATAGNQLFQLLRTGAVWRYMGTPCTGESCPGWEQLGDHRETVAIAGGGDQLYQRRANGHIWRYTGVPCGRGGCDGWERLDNNPLTQEIVAGSSHLYQRQSNGKIWRFVGPACDGETCAGWRELDRNPETIRIAVGGYP